MGSFVFGLLSVAVLFKNSYSGDPPGHMKPLGSYPPQQSVEALVEFPTPWDFYTMYVKPGKPVLFKSILNGSYPFYTRWTDEYLEKTYGDEFVEIEIGKKETRSGNMDFRELKDFLKSYKKLDIYLVQDAFTGMADEIMVPRCLHCGGFQKYIRKTVIWFSSGGTKSVIHADPFDNINCLLDGTKELVMADKEYDEQITAKDFIRDQGFVKLDVDRVNMYKFPKLQEVPWVGVQMEPGDCLFIPVGWWHQVNSFGKRNIALNLWFYHLLWFNMSDCEANKDLNLVEPLRKFGLASDKERQRSDLLMSFYEYPISQEDFVNGFTSGEKENRVEMFEFLDSDKDGVVNGEELYAFSVDELRERFSRIMSDLRPAWESDLDNRAAEMQELIKERKETGIDIIGDFLQTLNDKSKDTADIRDSNPRDEF